LRFTDITEQAGITFKHNNGAFGLKFLPETMGSGVACIDYDNDGYQDIFLVNSRFWNDAEIGAYQKGNWTQDEMEFFKRRLGNDKHGVLKKGVPAQRPRQHTASALYHNNRDGTFTDVTHQAGLDGDMYGMGAAVADYDNDGNSDLYVTGFGRNYLFRNLANGKFQEVAEKAGVRDSGWSTSAAWFDYNKDGRLDLFVGHYLQWTPAKDLFYSSNGQEKSYSAPTMYPPESSRLYRNVGGGRFVDASAQAGILTSRPYRFEEMPEYVQKMGRARFEAEIHRGQTRRKLFGKSLGVLVCDYNNDSWPDLLVANDGTPNYLFSNNRNGTFDEIAVRVGIALTDRGNARAGMGIDGGDIDHSGQESILIGNFAMEGLGLHKNNDGHFIDTAPGSEVGRASLPFLTFGCAFLDTDNDGWLDIFAANGPIPDFKTESLRGDMARAQRPLIFHNLGQGRFQEVGLTSGEVLQRAIVARGLAHADIDLDGDSDVVVTTNNGRAMLLRNDTSVNEPRGGTRHNGTRHNAIRLILQGTRSNRNGIDATVEARVGTETLYHRVRSGASYLSQSELPVKFGLGTRDKATAITIRWPSGAVTHLKDVEANQFVTVNESKGIVQRKPLANQ
jgi:hypothetical protein